MHGFKRSAAAFSLCAIALTGSGLAAHGVSAQSDVVGHVYVDDNPAGANTIAGFARHADGSLTPLPGSPFAVGGSGTGSGTGSQDALQISRDGRYLLAVDAGSNQISVLRIKPNGSLQQAAGSPVSSGGIKPVSIAIHDNLVYVANSGSPNLTGFTLNAGGHLRPLEASTVPLPPGSNPGDVLFNGAGTVLVGVLVGANFAPAGNDSHINTYIVGRGGRLTAAASIPGEGHGPLGSAFRPTNPDQLYVSNAHDGGGNGTVSAFTVANDGTLSDIGPSPYRDYQTAPCWVAIAHNGNYLFAVNTGSSTISSYAIGADGTLSLLGSTSISPSLTGVRAFDAALDASDANLYVVENGIPAVGVFSVSGGTVSEQSTSPAALPSGASPTGIVVN